MMKNLGTETITKLEMTTFYNTGILPQNPKHFDKELTSDFGCFIFDVCIPSNT